MRKLLVGTFGIGLFSFSMIWVLLELDWIENVVGGASFVLMVLTLAALPAWWAGHAAARAAGAAFDGGRSGLRRSDPDEERGREMFSAGMLTGVGVLALAVSSASWFNHAHAGQVAHVPATVIGRGHRESSPRSPEEWKLVVEMQGRREDVAVSAGEWSQSPPGAGVTLRMLSGAFGFPVVCSKVLRGPCAAEPIAVRGEPTER